MSLPVRNRTEFRIDPDALKQVYGWVSERVDGIPKQLSVAFVGDESMRRIHERYYGEGGTTDVLAFPYEDGSAEVVLNPFQHRRQAKRGGHTLNEEVVENLIHALLHLAGYDHTQPEDGGEHLRRQKELLGELLSGEVPRIIGADSVRYTVS